MSPWLPKQFSHGLHRQNNYNGVRAIDHGGENRPVNDWETQGYGVPIYVNIPYGFTKNPDPPHVPHNDNPVGSYRRVFTVPAEWKGLGVFIRFEAVKSAFYIWVNGRQVGYSQDSNTPAEGGPVLEFSALPYTTEDLTQESRRSNHPVDVPKRGFSCLTLDHVQMGVGGDAGSISSGELVHVPEFRLASDRQFWVIATV